MVATSDLSEPRGMYQLLTVRSRAALRRSGSDVVRRSRRYVSPTLILLVGSAVLVSDASPGIGWALLVLGATLATLALSGPPAATAPCRLR
jgi:hypothetical protein